MKGLILADKKLDFKVDYSKLNIFDEYNSKDIKFPMVLSVPHKGMLFPEEFLANSRCGIDELRSNEDSFVDELVKKGFRCRYSDGCNEYRPFICRCQPGQD